MADRIKLDYAPSSGDFRAYSEGAHPMRLVDVVDLGLAVKNFAGQAPEIKHVLALVFAGALAKDPSMRSESAGELANEFMALFNGQTISPGTLHIAEMARKAAEASKVKTTESKPSSPYRWVRFAIEAALVLSLAFVIFRFERPTSITVVATPVPINPNIPAGRLRFDDFSGVTPMDQITLSLNNVEFPEDGTHYESWLVPDDGGSPRKIGEVILNDAGVGQVILIDPDQQNLLHNSSQVIITQETDGVAANQPMREAWSTLRYFRPNP